MVRFLSCNHDKHQYGIILYSSCWNIQIFLYAIMQYFYTTIHVAESFHLDASDLYSGSIQGPSSHLLSWSKAGDNLPDITASIVYYSTPNALAESGKSAGMSLIGAKIIADQKGAYDFLGPRGADISRMRRKLHNENNNNNKRNMSIRVSAVFMPSTKTKAGSTKSVGRKNATDIRQSITTIGASTITTSLCLGIEEVFIALILVLLILTTVLGNVLVMLSVFMYKRMRTFNNFLLTSLATADLLVGLLIMPLSLVDLLYNHNWPFGRFLCSIWATSDVLLCTASILNLCIISLDRYMAITSPLKYPRTRSRLMACGLLCFVWGVAMIVCSPPWFIAEWGLFFNHATDDKSAGFICAYSPSIPYRIYSALVSFYIPLMVMLSVYFKIFRVASEREKLMRQNLGTCRLSRRVEKTQQKYKLYNSHFNSSIYALEVRRKKSAVTSNNYHIRCASEPMSHIREVKSTQQIFCSSEASEKIPSLHFHTSSAQNVTLSIDNAVTEFGVTRNDVPLSYRKSMQLYKVASQSSNIGELVARQSPMGKSRSSGANYMATNSNNEIASEMGNVTSTTESNNDCSTLNITKDKLNCIKTGGKINSISSYNVRDNNFPDCVELASSFNSRNSVGQHKSKITEILENEQQQSSEVDGKIQTTKRTNAINSIAPAAESAISSISFTCGSPVSTSSSVATSASRMSGTIAMTEPQIGSSTDMAKDKCDDKKYAQATMSNELSDLSMADSSAKIKNEDNADPGRLKANHDVPLRPTIMPHQPPNPALRGHGHKQRAANHLQPVNLLAKAQQHYNTNGPGKNIRGSKEKIVYLRERKALKTIGIVVLAFIICWMPFFVLYILQVIITSSISDSHAFKLVYEFFLWLGYSNSVLNPIIYTMYNGDFRRCFRDLLGFGCVQQHRRTMSVKKLHQQSTVF